MPYINTHEGETFITKEHLQDGAYYIGKCRNASIARWDAKENKFYYWRQKFSFLFIESINHPEDDDGFDLFYPKSGPVIVQIIRTPNHL